MFQKLGGLIGDIIPFFILLYFSLIASGIIKSGSAPERIRNASSYMKFILYAGTVMLAALIVMRVLE